MPKCDFNKSALHNSFQLLIFISKRDILDQLIFMIKVFQNFVKKNSVA